MSAQLLDGRAFAKQIRDRLKNDFIAFRASTGFAPALAVLRIGDDDASAGYARAIQKTCDSVGAEFRSVEMPFSAQQAEVEEVLTELNTSPEVHGIMILEPVPDHISHPALIDLLNPAKDVDGVHPINAGRLSADRPPYFVPATPLGGIRLLEQAEVAFKGKDAVVVGRSDIVGKPMALLLLHRHCTVTLAHSRTVDLPSVCRRADILCLAVGRPEMVKADWVKPGAIVVDFGTTYTEDGLKGDCDQAGVVEVAGMLTPVPGGTGPVTNVMLMENLLRAAERAVSN
ncbi:MAG: bifunctional 5,10-methylenetetrahydrofolate dehydrogenase/5,10-methenyltetrahydrofolate cyclohydrolase [Caldilinea sp.]